MPSQRRRTKCISHCFEVKRQKPISEYTNDSVNTEFAYSQLVTDRVRGETCITKSKIEKMLLIHSFSAIERSRGCLRVFFLVPHRKSARFLLFYFMESHRDKCTATKCTDTSTCMFWRCKISIAECTFHKHTHWGTCGVICRTTFNQQTHMHQMRFHFLLLLLMSMPVFRVYRPSCMCAVTLHSSM